MTNLKSTEGLLSWDRVKSKLCEFNLDSRALFLSHRGSAIRGFAGNEGRKSDVKRADENEKKISPGVEVGVSCMFCSALQQDNHKSGQYTCFSSKSQHWKHVITRNFHSLNNYRQYRLDDSLLFNTHGQELQRVTESHLIPVRLFVHPPQLDPFPPVSTFLYSGSMKGLSR